MANLYITSPAAGSGKTSFALSLTALLRERGNNAGYLKPFSLVADDVQALYSDPDIAFAARALAGSSPPQPLVAREPLGSVAAMSSRLQDHIRIGSSGLSTVLIDGLTAPNGAAQESVDLAGLAEAKVIAVVRYERGLDVGHLSALADSFGGLHGVVLNAVPTLAWRTVTQEAVPAIEGAGLTVLGVVPEDPTLLGFTVGEYKARLAGRIVNNGEKAGEIVERLLVGAMVLDESTHYYQGVENKALITRGDRPDLQWNALETSTRCLILTQGQDPIPYVVNKAEEAEVPIIVVPNSTLDVIAGIEGFIGAPSFHHPKKLARYTELLAEHLDLTRLAP